MALVVKTLTAVAVASTGTAVQISSTPIYATAVIIFVPSGNTGEMYVGGSSVSSANGIVVAKEKSFSISAEDLKQGEIDLSTIWVDAANNDDEVRVTYLKSGS